MITSSMLPMAWSPQQLGFGDIAFLEFSNQLGWAWDEIEPWKRGRSEGWLAWLIPIGGARNHGIAGTLAKRAPTSRLRNGEQVSECLLSIGIHAGRRPGSLGAPKKAKVLRAVVGWWFLGGISVRHRLTPDGEWRERPSYGWQQCSRVWHPCHLTKSLGEPLSYG